MGKDIIARTAARKAKKAGEEASKQFAQLRTVPFACNNGVLAYPQSNGTDTNKTFRTYHKAMVDAYDPYLAFGNYEVKQGIVGTGGEYDAPNPITIAASIEFPINSGTMYPLKFAGQKTVIIQPGDTTYSDPLPIEFYEDAEFQVRTNVQVTVGGKWVTTCEVRGDFGEGSGDGDLTETGTITTGQMNVYGPIGLFGKSNTTKPIVGLTGDSIITGLNDNRLLGIVQGFAARALINAKIPHIKVSRGGEYQSVFSLLEHHRRRMLLLKDCTYILNNHSTNDVRNTTGLTLATMLTNTRAIWRMFGMRGAKVYQCTSTPQSSSTDTWATIANQSTHKSNPLRSEWNQYLRGNPPEPYLAGVIDVCSAVEHTQDSGIWNVRGSTPFALTGDGTHPNGNGYGLMSTPVADWIKSL